MVIALICLGFLLVYPLVGLLVYSLRERAFYHRTGKKYADLFQEEVDEVREKADSHRSRAFEGDKNAQYLFNAFSSDLAKINFWKIKEVK